jgi:hypothetical protein
MKAAFLHVVVVLTSFAAAIAGAQESPYVLNRSRVVGLNAQTAWKNCVALVQAAPVIVNTIDSAAHLVTFSMPLSAADVKDLVLDAKDIEKQSLTLHVTIWIEEVGASTRLYVRAAPNGGGFFSHSNGLIEQRILDAIEKGEKWMPLSAEASPHTSFDAPPLNVEEAAVTVAKASKNIVLNASSPEPGVVTMSFTIRSADLGKFVPRLGKNYYPGVADITLWFEPSASGTAVLTRTVIFESGNLSPVPLTSNGLLESAIFDTIRKKLTGATDALITVGSDYRGKQDFWNVLFGLDATGKISASTQLSDSMQSPEADQSSEAAQTSGAAQSVTRDLPVTIDKAWAAGLHVITQSKVIVASDRSTGTFAFLTTHTSQIGSQYAVHRVVVSFNSIDSDTRMSIAIPQAQETAEEGKNELKLYTEQIGAELFVKDRLKWLTEKKGSK